MSTCRFCGTEPNSSTPEVCAGEENARNCAWFAKPPQLRTQSFQAKTLNEDQIDRLRGALRVSRDCVMESFEFVKTTDDQMMADARLRDIDDALAFFAH